MKSSVQLTPQELEMFKVSCNEIIRDAKTALASPEVKPKATPVPVRVPEPEVMEVEVMPAFKNVEARRDGRDVVHKPPAMKRPTPKESSFEIFAAGEGPASEEKPDPNSPFADLHGLSNTWQMPGMDNMTTDEYYAAINKRIQDMKNKRKAAPGFNSATMVSDYFDSLSKKPEPK